MKLVNVMYRIEQLILDNVMLWGNSDCYGLNDQSFSTYLIIIMYNKRNKMMVQIRQKNT